MTKAKLLICPYCGETQPERERCRACGGLFEPLSRLATHNAMGPWFIRDPARPFQPGCSYDTLVQLVERGKVGRYTIIRGPTTRQFWTIARRVPGVSHLFGVCHDCGSKVDPKDHQCPACGVAFGVSIERNELGLPNVRPLPWEATKANGHAKEPQRSEEEDLKGRISSFATNDELMGLVPPGGRAPSGELEVRLPALGLGDPEPPTDGAPVDEAPEIQAPDALERSLRRRLESQQRTIRTMGIVAVGMVIVVLVLLIDGRSVRTATPPSPVPAQSAGEADDRHAPLTPLQIELAIEEGLALSAAADDEHRPLAERIADVERAIEMLQRVRRAVGASPPPGFDEHLETLRLQRDRLRLREFFP